MRVGRVYSWGLTDWEAKAEEKAQRLDLELDHPSDMRLVTIPASVTMPDPADWIFSDPGCGNAAKIGE